MGLPKGEQSNNGGAQKRLHPQLIKLIDKFDSASELVRLLIDGLTPEQMTLRLDSQQWSLAECLIHLNLSSEGFLVVIREASQKARQEGVVGPGPFKLDFRGRVIRWMLKPPPRIKLRTTSRFEPTIIGPPEGILPRFLALQRELQNSIEQSDSLDLNKIVVISPFSKNVRYNLYSCFEVILTHQLRHLWQAEHVKRGLLRDRSSKPKAS